MVNVSPALFMSREDIMTGSQSTFKPSVSLILSLGGALLVSSCGSSPQTVAFESAPVFEANPSVEVESDPAELIYFGDPTVVTFDDFIAVQALFNLRGTAPSAAELAAEANRIFPSRPQPFMAGDFDPVPNAANTDYAIGDGGPNPELVDVLVIQASLNLPAGLRTPEGLAEAVNALDPNVNLQPEDILVIPGVELPGPRVEAAPESGSIIDLGAVDIGMTTVTQTLVIEQLGTGDLELDIRPPGARPEFSVVPAGDVIVTGDKPLEIDISCTPTAEGSITGQFRIFTNDPTTPQLNYQLRCEGLPGPGFSSDPVAGIVNLGAAAVGSTTAPTTITLSEVGVGDLELDIRPPATVDDFTVVPEGELTIVDGAGSQDLTVTCTPSEVGSISGQLRILTNDPTQPQVTYQLRCEGLEGPGFSSDPAPGIIDLGSAAVGSPTGPVTLTLSEVGAADLELEIRPPGAIDDFTVTPAGQQLIADGEGPLEITIDCTPSTEGTIDGQLRILTNDPAQPVASYRLRCEGTVGGFSSNPASSTVIDLGSANVGETTSTSTLTITEVGSGDLVLDIRPPAAVADFTVSPAGEVTIADGEDPLDIDISCTPSTSGTITGQFRILTNDPNLPTASYQLRCEGLGVASVLESLVINEILADPNGSNDFDTDGDGSADTLDEFVEVFNTSESAVDLSGLQLWDAGADDWFTFPSDSTIDAGGFAVVVAGVQSGGSLPFVESGSLAFNAEQGSGVINNSGDNVVLYDPTADEFIQITFNGNSPDDPTTEYTGFSPTATRIGSVTDFGSDTDGLSIERDPDGADTFQVDTPTPGSSNSDVGRSFRWAIRRFF